MARRSQSESLIQGVPSISGETTSLKAFSIVMSSSKLILNDSEIHRAMVRIAHEVAERNAQSSEVILVGIQKGGVHLAERLAGFLVEIWGHPVPVGSLDVTMHRDDLGVHLTPEMHPTTLPCDITGKTVVLVDDVLYSGRTIRAAMDALNDFGRPRAIQLAVLVDREQRELPITADYIGKTVPTSHKERVDVRLGEHASEDSVHLTSL